MKFSKIEKITLGLIAIPVIDVISIITTQYSIYEHLFQEFDTIWSMGGTFVDLSLLSYAVLLNFYDDFTRSRTDDARLEVYRDFIDTLDMSVLDEKKEY